MHTHIICTNTHTDTCTHAHTRTHTHTLCICKYIPCQRALQTSHLMKNNSQSKDICKLHIWGADNFNAGLHSRFALLLRHTKMPTKAPPVAKAATRRSTITPAAIAPLSAVLPSVFQVFPFPVFLFPFPVFPLPYPGLSLPLVQLHPLTTSDRTIRLRLSYVHAHPLTACCLHSYL